MSGRARLRCQQKENGNSAAQDKLQRPLGQSLDMCTNKDPQEGSPTARTMRNCKGGRDGGSVRSARAILNDRGRALLRSAEATFQ
jgi:hypothetical protein